VTSTPTVLKARAPVTAVYTAPTTTFPASHIHQLSSAQKTAGSGHVDNAIRGTMIATPRPIFLAKGCAPMVQRRRRFIFAAALAVASLLPGTGTATSTGGCPTGDSWQLVTPKSLGIVSGAPSLDGNGDGLTCIQYLPNYPRFPDAFVFRDTPLDRSARQAQ
jgi:hypothetical protein